MKQTNFICQQCGYKSLKWIGKCPECDNWNCFAEEVVQKISAKNRPVPDVLSKPELLSEIRSISNLRIKTDICELDHVLGGGIVEGSVVLVGGAPGIGKSTLLLQVCNVLGRKGKKVFYISAEESVQQTKMRAERIGLKDNLYIVSETNLDIIIGHIKKICPDVIIVDSVQVLYWDSISSAPGSVSQVRECAGRLTFLAKNSGISVFLVGHVTKDGSLAGPRVLEHLVDCVLYFEGEDQTNFRILRAIKNRFGSTNEIGIFEMTSLGLKEVANPSEMFLCERPKQTSGSVVVSTMEGTRPLLVEIQALVSQTNFGLPTRRATGIDFNRAALLTAVLEKRAHFALQTQDIFLNVAGGVKIVETAVDLAVIIAIASSFKEKPVCANDVIFGEVGLGGEVRAVSQANLRLNEAKKLGFERVILPKGNLRLLEDRFVDQGLSLVGVADIGEALDVIF
ncbi:MAG: DNA repair protein RadA [Candidatus Omnitrophota bacterium]|nr:MAG: DNA repair protein RadA [Candidatus Omnitrophota bacterium]